ncbi:endo-1,4-beta-xylanase [Micromonospora sp. WMMD1102]|uniref:endo-1,4-beta-xylanase n=1 Tax=Micromonospora sp. WMMD1102 TaxID=3016105 RepID=UPI0024155080|nr:endo-1,4-beta-xylanase [Micromonospora sp. WMMD1102]MDG4786155.1 endo-1,4-beta-xylanase [Micromonospora sp. WMMD1102]
MSSDSLVRQHRTATATLTVTGGGVPLDGQEVVVAQRDHAFLFGCTGLDSVTHAAGQPESATPEAVASEAVASGAGSDVPAGGGTARSERMGELWLDLFNFATLPFYWGWFEPERGRPDTRRLQAAARWFTDRGCLVKGHPLAWHTESAQWLTELSNAEITEAQLDRIRREVTDFAGLIDTWDVINEVVIMPIFDKYDNGLTRICRELGRIPLVRTVFDAAREANPRATLLLNDFDMSAAYECLIEGVLEAGIRIDALGLQSHMHQGYWGEEKTLGIIDRFARYGLPIHFTETTLLSGHLMPADIVDLNDYQIPEWPSTPEGEERQADEVVRHYRTLLSHPSVRASTYWGMVDGGWLGAPGGFVRADGTPKPSYHALRTLVRDEWWLAPTTLGTDERGRVGFTGFLGEYEVSAGGRTATFRLDQPGPATLTVEL